MKHSVLASVVVLVCGLGALLMSHSSWGADALEQYASIGGPGKMSLRLTPSLTESRIMIELVAAGAKDASASWSLLVPETVSCREDITTHCHVIPPKWTEVSGGWEVELALDKPKCIYRTRVTKVDDEVVDISFSIRNNGKAPMTDTEADFCFCCVGQPEFGAKDWYNRSYARVSEQIYTGAEYKIVHKFVPIGAMRTYFGVARNPVYSIFAWNLADSPIAYCVSKDGNKVYAAGFERAGMVGTSVGVCIHAWPWLGTILPGREVTRRGRFYYVTGGMEDVAGRFAKDFGIPDAE